jgi:hypothetical protein
MIWLLCFVLAALTSPFKSKIRLEAENAALRHQLIVLRRKLRGRVKLANSDRWFFIQLYRWFPSILEVLTVIRPETLVGWHRAGFRSYWRWKWSSGVDRPVRDGGPSCVITRRTLPPWTCSLSRHRTGLTLAERLCRTANRIDPARVFGPCHCLGRVTFASNSKILRRLLQLRQNTSIVEQGCAGFSPGSANRCDQFTRHPGRTSSLLWPCLSFRYRQRRGCGARTASSQTEGGAQSRGVAEAA